MKVLAVNALEVNCCWQWKHSDCIGNYSKIGEWFNPGSRNAIVLVVTHLLARCAYHFVYQCIFYSKQDHTHTHIIEPLWWTLIKTHLVKLLMGWCRDLLQAQEEWKVIKNRINDARPRCYYSGPALHNTALCCSRGTCRGNALDQTFFSHNKIWHYLWHQCIRFV